MKRDDLQRKKRRLASVIAILLVLALIFSTLAPLIYAVQAQTMTIPVAATTGQQNTGTALEQPLAKEIGLDSFTANLSIGFDQGYIVGKVAPISGVITSLGEAFEGELQIRVNDYEGEETNKHYSLYYLPLSISAGSAKQVAMYANIGVVRKSFQVSLVNNAGETKYLKNFQVKALDPATTMTGVLTESPNAAFYLNNLNLASNADYTGQLNKTVYLNQSTFPERADVLRNFKVLIIDNFDTRSLSPEQLRAIQDYTQAGGLLVLGTGPNAAKVLGGLSEIANFQIGQSENISNLQNIASFLNANPSQYGAMPITAVTADGLVGVYNERESIITSAMDYGVGRIVLHHFALSLKPISEISGVEKLLREIYMQAAPIAFDEDLQFEPISNQLYNLADSFPFLHEKGLMSIFVCLGIYILVIGPMLYTILKKKDKRELGWVVIPALSVLFTIVVFVIGRGSAYQNNLFNTVSVTDLPTQGSEKAISYVGAAMKTSDTGDVHFHINDALQTLGFDSDRYYYRGNYQEQDVLSRKILADGKSTDVTFVDKARWESSIFTAAIPVHIGGGVVSTLRLENNGRIIGKLTNESDLDFEDVLIAVNNQYLRLSEPLLAGKSLDVDLPLDLQDYNMDSLGLAFGLSDGSYYRNVQSKIREKQITRAEGYEIMQKMRMIEQVSDNSYSQKYSTMNIQNAQGITIKFYGFNNAKVLSDDITINGKKPIANHAGIYRTAFIQKWKDMPSFEIPADILPPVAEELPENSRYDNKLYSDSGGESMVFFYLPNETTIDSFVIINNTDIQTLVQEPEIYNYKTNSFETLFLGEYTNTADYIGLDSEIQLRFVIPQQTEITLPSISVKGGGQ